METTCFNFELSYLDLSRLSRTVTIAALTTLVIEMSVLTYLLNWLRY